MNKNASLAEIRNKYPTFSYEGFSYSIENEEININFKFNVEPDIAFNPKIKIKGPINIETTEKNDVLDNLIFHLGLMEIPSYWKATCSPTISVKPAALNVGQTKWWKKLMIKGLGEFFYTNKIDFRDEDFIEFVNKTNQSLSAKDVKSHKDRSLVLLGGGKDSALTMDVLQELREDINLLMVNPQSASRMIANKAKIDSPIVIEREIDQKLLELNDQGFFNGHTPFSAYLAFIGVLCALLFDYKYVVTSNETSSNQANLKYLNHDINHQYSKSSEFEEDFRNYVRQYLSREIEFYSLLRPLNELQITKNFIKRGKYMGDVLSCNVGQRDGRWCGECAKCLSTFILFAPFAGIEKTTEIFKENLLDKENVERLLNQIIGKEQPKPFECVAAYEESIAALFLAKHELESKSHQLPYLLRNFDYELTGQQLAEVLDHWGDSHHIPKDLESKIRQILK